MSTALGLVRVVPNSELVRMEKEAQKAQEEAFESNDNELYTGLSKHVMSAWEDARTAKQSVLPRLQQAQRARIGEYDPEKKAQIAEFGGSDEYARISANKIRVVEAWLRDVFLGQKDKPWRVNPTPKPSFPPDAEQQVREAVSAQVAQAFASTGDMPDPVAVRAQISAEMSRFEEALMESARDTADRMEKKIDDQLKEARWEVEFASFLGDLATYPAAILKGPILRKKQRLAWTGEDPASPEAEIVEAIIPEVERVDPFRIYPAPGAVNPQEGYIFEHHTFAHAQLYELIDVPGYDEEAIRAVLRQGEGGGLHDWLGFHTESESYDSIPQQLQKNVFEYDVLEYHGPVLGKDLMEWGLNDDTVNDPEAVYEACVWMCGQWVLKAQVNYDPMGMRPYYKTSYEEVPGEFWGFGLPGILADVQGVVNAALRSLVNNMGMASGPQVAINIDRLPPDQDITNLTPWNIWQVQDSQFGTNSQKAIEFYQPNSNVTDLLTVLEKFYQLADDFSLVPRYMAGSDKVGGAGRTASGLSMLMDAANKGLKGVVANVDSHVLTPLLTKMYHYNMLYDEDPTIKGDAQVVASGAVSLMRLESMQLRRNEFLQVTANPFDMQIIGPEGRSEVLRSVADGLELNTDKIVPPEEELQKKMQQAMRQQMIQQGTGKKSQQGAPQQMQQAAQPKMSKETLQDGSATTDNFSPNGLTS